MIILKESTAFEEVVVSASRSPEKVLESPVTIERMGLTDVKKNSSISFYDGLTNLKGIEARELNYGYKSINSRGFSNFENPRFVQLVDGVDGAMPSFNFSLGNLTGLSDLDIEDVEILPGASSALYGANAFNGILLMRSKNPFDYDGISTYVKTGIMNQEASGKNNFYDVGVRMAYKFNKNLAVKVNFTKFGAEEWHANDYSNINGEDLNATDYNGVNVYGDEDPANLTNFNINSVSRTGYAEKDLYHNEANGMKFDGALHYRPMGNDKLEIVYSSRFSSGSTIYQGSSRFALDGYFAEQHKLEFLGKNFVLRGYYTGNDLGDKSFDMQAAGLALNQKYSNTRAWVGDYGATFRGFLPGTGVPPNNHEASRAYADRNRFIPGTSSFNSALNEIISTPLSDFGKGAGIKDKTGFYHADINYNFKDVINFGEIQVGGSYREFKINSNGTLYSAKKDNIIFDVYGLYAQVQKKFFEDRVKFTGSVRYDKSTNFDGDFSPRIALNYSLKENSILRLSFQTGFRNPSSTEQYYGLQSGINKFVLGTTLDNLSLFSGRGFNALRPITTITGNDVFEKAFVLNSGNFEHINLEAIKPEKVSTLELGYRGIVNISDSNILELDINGYYNKYNNFITTKQIYVPNYGSVTNGTPDTDVLNAFNTFSQNGVSDVSQFAISTNTVADVSSYGVGLGLNTKVFKTFNLGVNYTLTKLVFDEKDDPDFESGFNTPEHQFKLMFGNAKLFKNFGFNVNVRWQDEFLWQSTFIDGVVSSRTVLDAQINYLIPSLKSRIKVGGTNLGGKEYVVAPGSGLIGSMYYVSWTINN